MTDLARLALSFSEKSVVERWVQVEQVYGGGVHAPQNVEVIAGPQGAVVPVGRPLSGSRFLFSEQRERLADGGAGVLGFGYEQPGQELF